MLQFCNFLMITPDTMLTAAHLGVIEGMVYQIQNTDMYYSI